jgi:ribose transport system substrate-binding protein
MVRKRPWLAAVAAVAVLACAAGCGDDDEGGASGGAAASTTATTDGADTTAASGGGQIDVGVGKITPDTGNKKIAFMTQASEQYTYIVAQVKSAEAEAKKLGYDLDIMYSNLDPATELSNFNQAMSGKYAGFIMHAVNTQLCGPAKAQAVQKQVIIGVIGNALCTDGSAVGEAQWAPGTAFYVGGANDAEGIEAVLKKAAEDNPGPQKIGFILGPKGNPSGVAWETAWKKFGPTHPDFDLVTTQYTDFTTPGAFKATQDVLQSQRDINILFDLYIDVGVGVAKAIEAADKAGEVKLYENGGGSTVAKKLVQKGTMTGDLPVYPADNARVGIQQLVQALQGKQPEKYTGGDGNPDFFEVGVVTKDTVESFTPQW